MSVRHSKNWDRFLKCVKENDQEKKETKKNGTWVQLEHQSVPPRESLREFQIETAGTHFLWNHGITGKK